MAFRADSEPIPTELDIDAQRALLAELTVELAREERAHGRTGVDVEGLPTPVPIRHLLRALQAAQRATSSRGSPVTRS